MKSALRNTGFVALLLITGPALADPAAQYSSSDFVSAILSGPKPCPPGQSQSACEGNAKTRRWSVVSSSGPRAPLTAPVASGPARAPAHHPRAAQVAQAAQPVSAGNILVTFALGSADLTAQGKANLRSAAAGLNSDSLASVNFEIAGYTDASGSEIDNFFLSGRRADAVRDFLVGLGVRADRLSTAGYGSAHLAVPADPGSELNRRVEMHRLN
jgi:outer membrane protein OmpA-like peptidoglycan-associated protein